MAQVGIFEDLPLIFLCAFATFTLPLSSRVLPFSLLFLLLYLLRAFPQLLRLVYGTIVMLSLLDHFRTLNELVLGQHVTLNGLLFADIAQLAEHYLQINRKKSHA
jgi:hypothetical protein